MIVLFFNLLDYLHCKGSKKTNITRNRVESVANHSIQHYTGSTQIIVQLLLQYNTSCSDVDECALGTDDCDDNASCSNTVGSYTCTCNTGYHGDGLICSGKCVVCVIFLAFIVKMYFKAHIKDYCSITFQSDSDCSDNMSY